MRRGTVLLWCCLAVLAVRPSVLAADAQQWLSMVNLKCVHAAIVGACVCPPNIPCVVVSYWEPGWFIETVKISGSATMPVIGGMLETVLTGLGVPPIGGGGAGNASGAGHTNLHFNEAHVVTFPQLLGGPCTSCAPGAAPFTLHYASETDPLWRTAVAIPSPLDLVRAFGVWGRLYPRGGKAIHGSEPVASGLAAARAMDISFNPWGEPPNVEQRVVFQRTDETSRCMQLASPKQTPCFTAGSPPVLWEHGAVSSRGTYQWLVWRKRTCCVLPNQAMCGITFVGKHGGNTCVLPTLPGS